jgi:hypothetical protein
MRLRVPLAEAPAGARPLSAGCRETRPGEIEVSTPSSSGLLRWSAATSGAVPATIGTSPAAPRRPASPQADAAARRGTRADRVRDAVKRKHDARSGAATPASPPAPAPAPLPVP